MTHSIGKQEFFVFPSDFFPHSLTSKYFRWSQVIAASYSQGPESNARVWSFVEIKGANGPYLPQYDTELENLRVDLPWRQENENKSLEN